MSALILRIIACLAMLLDHIGYYSNNLFLRAIGRVAFPIFVYLICNGYKHTSCKWRYALRLAVFAVISQIPFSLFCTNTITYMQGNVFITLLIALLCIWATDMLLRNRVTRWLCWLPMVVIGILYQLGVLRSDYGVRGIILAMAFYLLDGRAVWKRILTVLACLIAVFYNQLISVGLSVVTGSWHPIVLSTWDWWQLFSLGSLPLIFLYNGKKGPQPANRVLSKLTQIGFYLFYPAHMLVLWLLAIL